jgi:putative CocE/NonD family hydrolase
MDLMPRTTFGKSPRQPLYKGVTTESLYVPMSDGVRIAVDVMRPRSAPMDIRLPAILIIARYWRSFALRGLAPRNRAPVGPRQPWPDFVVSQGYAVVAMDTRGSGASTGSTPYPFSERELEDYREVVDWIVHQPWSDGRVGATGISYEGIAAELLTVAHPGATKVVVPQQADIDQYAEFLFPGGIPNEWMIATWQHTNEALDRNRMPAEWTSSGSEDRSVLYRVAAWLSRFAVKGVRPVDADTDGSQLRQAVAEHAANGDVAAYSRAVTYRDDPFGPTGITVDALSSMPHQDRIARSGAAVFAWGSWLDGCTADGVIRRFASSSNPRWGVIGAWSHGYLNHGSPYGEPRGRLRPDIKALWQETLEYFDYYLKDVGDPTLADKKLFYYTLGEEAWKVTTVWPPVGAGLERWYFAEAKTLSREAPAFDEGADSYVVDFEATTGLTNRWRTQDGVTRVFYGDRAEADRRLLTYTSAPLGDDVEITGHPVVTLYVASTATDGAFYVYLEDVDENGWVTYVTEGHLRALHRRLTGRRPPLALFVPHHSFLREDAMALVPGEVAEVRFGLQPTSCRIRRGHRLRVAIAGHDKGTFAQIPDERVPTLAVQRNRRYASQIELPIIRI